MLALILAAILYLSLMVVCGRYTAKYAALRQRSKAAWFVWGALFYPLPYLVLPLLPAGMKDDGRPTPPSAKRGPADASPASRAGTPSKSGSDTAGYQRGRLVPVRV
jgi:hypothetical protein